MGVEVYTRTSYNVPFNIDAESRIFSAKLELALINVINNKISNGIKDVIYSDMALVNDTNYFIGVIFIDKYAIVSCYDLQQDALLDELPYECFKDMEKEDIQFFTDKINHTIEQYVKSYNHQRNGLDDIKNCKTPLLVENMRKHLDNLAKSVDLSLASKHIVFSNYPPIPEHFKNR